MPISGPPPGIPQVPIGAHKIWRAQVERKQATKTANVPLIASPAGILRALMLSGLAASALQSFQSVVGDVETDMDDLVDTIQQWLRSQQQVGFSRQSRPPERNPREVAIPVPIKPLKRGETIQRLDTEIEPREGRPRKTKRDRNDEAPYKGESYWSWLERRFGNPPRHTNISRRYAPNGIASF